MAEGTGTPKKAPLTLEQYVLKQRIADCSVCALPEEAREGILRARKKKIPRDSVIAWLKEVFAWSGDDDELTAHANAHHDKKMRELA